MNTNINHEFNIKLANVNAINALLLNVLNTANNMPLVEAIPKAACRLNSEKLTSFAKKYHIIKDNEKIILSQQSIFVDRPELSPAAVHGVTLDPFMFTAFLDFETTNIYDYGLVGPAIEATLSSFQESNEIGFYLVSDKDVNLIYRGWAAALIIAYLYWDKYRDLSIEDSFAYLEKSNVNFTRQILIDDTKFIIYKNPE